MKKLLFIAPLLSLIFPLHVRTQSTDDVPLPPAPYTTSGTARFFPVARDLVIPPGGHTGRILNVFGMGRAAVQAAARSTPGDGALHVRIGFGPPHVFDPAARIDLLFADSDSACAATLAPVKGPRMTPVLDKDRAVPVKLSVGVYASN